MTTDPNKTAHPEITKQVSDALNAFLETLPDTLRTYHVIGILASITRNFATDRADAADLVKDLLVALAASFEADEQRFGPDTDDCMCPACVEWRKAQAH